MAGQQSFCHFLELVPELGMLIIDKMEADDRCRFSGSSKLCNKKAKNSKNYIYGLNIHASDGYSRIIVKHGSSQGFSLFFEKNTTVMRCGNWRVGDNGELWRAQMDNSGELWRTQLDKSTDLFRIGNEKFKVLLQKYGNTIKQLTIVVEEPVDFELRSLNNLEELIVHCETDIRQFLSKKRKSLTKLIVTGRMNGKFLENQEEIFEVKEVLALRYTQLNNQQFLQLSAATIRIHIGQLTENDIYNFVRSWQNGTIRNKNVQRCDWNLNNSSFNEKKLFELFGDDSKQEMEFKHEGDATRVARLIFSRPFMNNLSVSKLYFRILSPEEIGRSVFLSEDFF